MHSFFYLFCNCVNNYNNCFSILFLYFSFDLVNANYDHYLDIDECEVQPCQNNGTCVDLINEYQCYCIDGFNDKNCTNSKLR